MQRDPTLDAFIKNRARINERLDETRVALDAWIESYLAVEANVTGLARLEGLVAERRDFLDQLARLDDSLLDHLVTLLSKRGQTA